MKTNKSGNPHDIEANKAIAILAYILFFLPLLAAKDSRFALYHANQGLIVFLIAIGVNVIGSIIPLLGWFLILPFGNLAVLILVVMGILTAGKGEMKPLPLVGGFTIIK